MQTLETRKTRMRGWASFDPSEVYRYTLHRRWDSSLPRVCFCLLNPSTADARVLDPTLTRCLGFAQRWGFGSMEVVNIFALRSTQPSVLKGHADPVGPDNDKAIRRAVARSERVVLGWGTHGALNDRHGAVLDLLRGRCEPMCWATTKDGFPKHPLYLRSDNAVMPFAGA